MKALRKEKAGAGASYADIPTPEVTSHRVLVKVHAASFCGTDLHIYRWDEWASQRVRPPLTFGHEFAGEVVEVGTQVERIKVGDRVAGETHIPCLECHQCRTGQMHICQNLEILGVDCDGAFAEYIALPEVCCVKTDASIPWEIATLQEPFGNSVYTVSESNVMGKTVAVFGDGPAGVFATAVARAFGATKIFSVGMQSFRLELLRKFSPDMVIDAGKTDAASVILEKTGGSGVDVVLEMSGSPQAIHNGFKVVRKGGIFTAFGIPSNPVPINMAEEIIFKGITIKAINGRKMFETWEQVQNLLVSGRVDLKPVVTHKLPMSKIDDAVALLEPGNVRAGKIILTP